MTFLTDMKNTQTQQGLRVFLMNCLSFKLVSAFLMEWDNLSKMNLKKNNNYSKKVNASVRLRGQKKHEKKGKESDNQ